MSDREPTDNAAELLDDDVLPEEYPPERPMGVDDYGVTAQEERIDEPLEERVAREQADDEGDGLADGDPVTGDPDLRDVAQERAPIPAEEDAVHVDPGASGT